MDPWDVGSAGEIFGHPMFDLKDDAVVLEVGSGSSPWKRSDVLLDRFYIDETGQRSGADLYRDHRPMIVAAGERLPFKDKAFDFMYSCHVIEHAEDIASMLREMSRVAKAGFIECPNPLLERILDQAQHNWYITNVNGRLLIAPKNTGTNVSTRADRFYFHMMSDHFIVRHYWDMFVTRLHWRNAIEFEICDSVGRVFEAQSIPADLGSCLQGRVSSVLRKAWFDAKRQDIKRLVKALPGARSLVKAARTINKQRSSGGQPRVNAETLHELLACPYCRTPLTRLYSRYVCASCSRSYADNNGVTVFL